MGGLLHLVQRGETWAGYGSGSPLIAVPNLTAHQSTASVPTSYYRCGTIISFSLRSVNTLAASACEKKKIGSSVVTDIAQPPADNVRQNGDVEEFWRHVGAKTVRTEDVNISSHWTRRTVVTCRRRRTHLPRRPVAAYTIVTYLLTSWRHHARVTLLLSLFQIQLPWFFIDVGTL